MRRHIQETWTYQIYCGSIMRINWKLKTPGRKSSLNLWIFVPYCVAVGTDLFTRNNSKETPAHIHQMPKCLFSSSACFILNPKKEKNPRSKFVLCRCSTGHHRIIKSLFAMPYPFGTLKDIENVPIRRNFRPTAYPGRFGAFLEGTQIPSRRLNDADCVQNDAARVNSQSEWVNEKANLTRHWKVWR